MILEGSLLNARKFLNITQWFLTGFWNIVMNWKRIGTCYQSVNLRSILREVNVVIKAVSVKPMAEYKVDILLEDGRKVIFDMRPFLDKDLYKPLLDVSFFETVKVDEFGVVCWNNDIDISPYLY